MTIASEDIYSLLIPLEEDRLVVPRSCVAEVIRYSAPVGNDADSWLCGSVTWNNLDIPVVSFERMCDMSPPTPAGRTRIVVFHPVSGRDDIPYGLLAEGFPQMVRVSSEVLKVDQGYKPPSESPIICRVHLLQEQALIPDLELIEQRLSAALAVS
jgi:chemosensory pili system protein ChpC